MNRSQLCVILAVVGALLWTRSPVLAGDDEEPTAEDYFLAGVELGATGATNPLSRYVNNGFTLAPFGAYMFNKHIGLMGQMHLIGMPSADACKPERLSDGSPNPEYDYNGCYKNRALEADWVWALGATVGPRLALPIGGVEIWGTVQGGGFTGLSSSSTPISKASWALSTGGGVNIEVTENILIGVFGRYNYLYQNAHSRGEVKYGAGGISTTYKFAPPKPLPVPK